MTKHHWNKLSREELSRLLPTALVVFPTGATEQHGPHLATGHDAFVASELSERAASIAGQEIDIIITPILEFGSSDHHLTFGGTLSLGTDIYLQVVKRLLHSMIVSGATRVMVLNGHGGNHELNEVAVRDVVLEQSEDADIIIGAASYWNIAANRYAGISELRDVRIPGHAGQFETSMILALSQSHVRCKPAVRDHDPSSRKSIAGMRVEGEVRWSQFDGYTDFPDRARATLGEVIIEVSEQAVANEMLDFYSIRRPMVEQQD